MSETVHDPAVNQEPGVADTPATAFNPAGDRVLVAGEKVRVTLAVNHTLEPGQTCPRCDRRVPHPRKESSPRETKTDSFRAPADLVDELRERLDRLAADTGLASRPYSKARVLMLLLTLADAVSRETLLSVASEMSWGASL